MCIDGGKTNKTTNKKKVYFCNQVYWEPLTLSYSKQALVDLIPKLAIYSRTAAAVAAGAIRATSGGRVRLPRAHRAVQLRTDHPAGGRRRREMLAGGYGRLAEPSAPMGLHDPLLYLPNRVALRRRPTHPQVSLARASSSRRDRAVSQLCAATGINLCRTSSGIRWKK